MNLQPLIFYIKLFCIPIALASSFSSCVSVSLPGQEISPAKNVEFKSPETPFEEINLKSADRTWISKITGNTVSFLSDCQKNSDPTLEQMLSDSTSVIDHLKIIESQEGIFNNRSSLESIVEGSVDGVPVKMKVLVFKKNSCNYTLTYAGLKIKFTSEFNTFENFQTSFRAP